MSRGVAPIVEGEVRGSWERVESYARWSDDCQSDSASVSDCDWRV